MKIDNIYYVYDKNFWNNYADKSLEIIDINSLVDININNKQLKIMMIEQNVDEIFKRLLLAVEKDLVNVENLNLNLDISPLINIDNLDFNSKKLKEETLPHKDFVYVNGYSCSILKNKKEEEIFDSLKYNYSFGYISISDFVLLLRSKGFEIDGLLNTNEILQNIDKGKDTKLVIKLNVMRENSDNIIYYPFFCRSNKYKKENEFISFNNGITLSELNKRLSNGNSVFAFSNSIENIIREVLFTNNIDNINEVGIIFNVVPLINSNGIDFEKSIIGEDVKTHNDYVYISSSFYTINDKVDILVQSNLNDYVSLSRLILLLKSRGFDVESSLNTQGMLNDLKNGEEVYLKVKLGLNKNRTDSNIKSSSR